MTTNFPGALDSFPTHVDNVTDVLAAHSNNMQAAIAALQAKVGVNNSADANSIDAKLRSSAVIGAAMANVGPNDVGSDAFMQILGTSSYTTGQFVSGNNLRFASIQIKSDGLFSTFQADSTTLPTGSWMCKAATTNNPANFRFGFFLKVSA